jgi:phosphonate transport system ATP-binding protein
VDYAMRYCRRVVALKAGQVAYDGPASGLSHAKLIDIYGPEIEEVFWEGGVK